MGGGRLLYNQRTPPFGGETKKKYKKRRRKGRDREYRERDRDRDRDRELVGQVSVCGTLWSNKKKTPLLSGPKRITVFPLFFVFFVFFFNV